MDRTQLMEAAFVDRSRLYSYALRLTKDSHAAEDLLGDVLVKAGRSAHQFKEGTNLHAWLCTITRTLYINSYRAERRRNDRLGNMLSIDDDSGPNGLDGGTSQSQRLVDRLDPCVEDIVLNTFADPKLTAAVRDLPENWQKLIQLVDIEGRPYQEAAETLDIPIGSVMSGLHRARKRLAETVLAVA